MKFTPLSSRDEGIETRGRFDCLEVNSMLYLNRVILWRGKQEKEAIQEFIMLC